MCITTHIAELAGAFVVDTSSSHLIKDSADISKTNTI